MRPTSLSYYCLRIKFHHLFWQHSCLFSEADAHSPDLPSISTHQRHVYTALHISSDIILLQHLQIRLYRSNEYGKTKSSETLYPPLLRSCKSPHQKASLDRNRIPPSISRPRSAATPQRAHPRYIHSRHFSRSQQHEAISSNRPVRIFLRIGQAREAKHQRHRSRGAEVKTRHQCSVARPYHRQTEKTHKTPPSKSSHDAHTFRLGASAAITRASGTQVHKSGREE